MKISRRNFLKLAVAFALAPKGLLKQEPKSIPETLKADYLTLPETPYFVSPRISWNESPVGRFECETKEIKASAYEAAVWGFGLK